MSKPVKHYGKWRIRWFDSNGRRRSEVFDSYQDAEFKQRQYETEAEEVRRGLRLPRPIDRTFSELCDYWLNHRTTRKRSPKDDISIISAHLRKFFGCLRISEISVEQVDSYIAKRSHLNKKTVANQLTLLVSMLNLAKDLGWILRVPRIKKPRTPLFCTDFRYLRTQSEIDKFLRSASDESKLAFAIYATAVFTGMREGELAGLKWADVDFSQRLITVQRSFDGPTKAEDVRYVPILDALLPILRDWRLSCTSDVVFPNERGKMQIRGAKIFRDIFHRVQTRAFLCEENRSPEQSNRIRFHDLRHTFASQWVIRGGDIFKLQRILGHKSITMTQRYAHLAPHAFVSDYSRLGELRSIERECTVRHLNRSTVRDQ